MILFNHQDFPVFLEFLVRETLFPGGAGNGFPWEEEEEEDLNLSQLQGDDLGFFWMFSRAPTPSGPSGKCQSQFPGPINPRTKVDPNPVPGEPPGPSLSGTEFPIGKKPLNQPWINYFSSNKLMVFMDGEECGHYLFHGNSSPMGFICGLGGGQRKSREMEIKSQLNPSSLLSLIIYPHPEKSLEPDP